MDSHQIIDEKKKIIIMKIKQIYFSFLPVSVHKLNEINSLTHLHIVSHKMSKEYKQTVEIIKMKMFAIV